MNRSVVASDQQVDSKSITTRYRSPASTSVDEMDVEEVDDAVMGWPAFVDDLLTPLWRKMPFSIANCLAVFSIFITAVRPGVNTGHIF